MDKERRFSVNHRMAFVAWVLLLGAGVLVSGCTSRSEPAAVRRMTMKEIPALLVTESKCLILDVRTTEEYREGHLPGALSLPNESIGEVPPALLPDRNVCLLLYCRSGRRSQQAAQKLARMGYTNVVDLGGLRDWTGPLERE